MVFHASIQMDRDFVIHIDFRSSISKTKVDLISKDAKNFCWFPIKMNCERNAWFLCKSNACAVRCYNSNYLQDLSNCQCMNVANLKSAQT